jgi:alkanesulfonate monooxygenase SsuD/methylene tetrahydromethanopterin reductase-like flavin-dependent oxidoreductase (luciferase family)
MLGSVSPRMMRIGLPHVDAWNVWWSDYRNDAESFATVRTRVEEAVEQAGRAPGDVEATAAVLVQLPGGVGRLMGETYDDRTVRPVHVSDLADHLRAMADAGAAHVQLVLDPITIESIEAVGEPVREFRDG